MTGKKKKTDDGHRVTIRGGHYFMMTIHEKLRRSAFVLALSIAAMPSLVNGQGQNLTSVNKSSAVTKLIEIVLKNGTDSNIKSILASVIGIPKAMPMKKQEVMINESGNDFEQRACYVIYENVGSTVPEVAEKRVEYTYIVKIKRSGLDNQVRYFRIDLNGTLEKAVLSQSKFDETCKVVRGSGVKFDQDINSPEVKQTFNQEMKFWLKDWLKKELKAPAQKPA